MNKTRFRIILSRGDAVEVEDGFGPLSDFDAANGDPADGADAIWAAIDRRDPIWTSSPSAPRVWYFSPAHVIAVIEIPR